MLRQSWEHLDEGLVEPLEGVGRPVLQRAQVQEQPDGRVVRVVVGASKDLSLKDLEVRGRRRFLLRRLAPGLLTGSRASGSGAHSEASFSSSASGSISLRERRSNQYPVGRAWTIAPETIMGRYPLMWNASVATLVPSTMVTAPFPTTSRVRSA